eukprot:CAMPEP_0182420056 /NCGR_PEP_ID=MMETSP1167-20130531/4569_1 /TAXON_ID=2988 /ORGANISM="Mallomonas Sp, Strain CCMP3275" /LENGTH=219 /DNA_ID=CAMNT_0024595475 /DNA_START=14 /DNA_END=673 /DNA_ORIENTATION=-
MADKFLNSCEELSIRKLVFVRHANANPISGGTRSDQPHDWKFRDQTRTLSAKGIDQALKNKVLLSEFSFKANLTSPARRASETAVYMTRSEEEDSDICLRLIESLHPAGMSEICEDLFDMMGYGPLTSFFEAPKGKESFIQYAESVCAELAIKVTGPAVAEISYGDALGIYGHAVFLNAVVFHIADTANIPTDMLLEVDLGEAEAIVLDFNTRTLSHLR